MKVFYRVSNIQELAVVLHLAKHCRNISPIKKWGDYLRRHRPVHIAIDDKLIMWFEDRDRRFLEDAGYVFSPIPGLKTYIKLIKQ